MNIKQIMDDVTSEQHHIRSEFNTKQGFGGPDEHMFITMLGQAFGNVCNEIIINKCTKNKSTYNELIRLMAIAAETIEHIYDDN